MIKIFKNNLKRLISLVGMVAKRDLVLKCWEYGKDMKVNFDDLYLYAGMFDKGIISLGDILVKYRSRPVSHGNSGKYRDIKAAHKIIEKFFIKENLQDKLYEAGALDFKYGLLPKLALLIIPKLPKKLRDKFFEKYCAYDWRIEKL
jgi:hypothetical protein